MESKGHLHLLGHTWRPVKWGGILFHQGKSRSWLQRVEQYRLNRDTHTCIGLPTLFPQPPQPSTPPHPQINGKPRGGKTHQSQHFFVFHPKKDYQRKYFSSALPRELGLHPEKSVSQIISFASFVIRHFLPDWKHFFIRLLRKFLWLAGSWEWLAYLKLALKDAQCYHQTIAKRDSKLFVIGSREDWGVQTADRRCGTAYVVHSWPFCGRIHRISDSRNLTIGHFINVSGKVGRF